MLAKCGFRSLTLVDGRAGYTAVLKELAILRDDLSGMLRADDNERRVMLHTIGQLAKQMSPSWVASAPLGSAYLGAILLDRWGHMQIDRLSLDELEQLRYTLSARASAHRRAGQAADHIADVSNMVAPEPAPEPGPSNCPF